MHTHPFWLKRWEEVCTHRRLRQTERKQITSKLRGITLSEPIREQNEYTRCLHTSMTHFSKPRKRLDFRNPSPRRQNSAPFMNDIMVIADVHERAPFWRASPGKDRLNKSWSGNNEPWCLNALMFDVCFTRLRALMAPVYRTLFRLCSCGWSWGFRIWSFFFVRSCFLCMERVSVMGEATK